MLHFMRRFANSWGGKILGAALIVALAAFGVPSILATLDANSLTKVGDQDITTSDFMRLYQQNLQTMAAASKDAAVLNRQAKTRRRLPSR